MSNSTLRPPSAQSHHQLEPLKPRYIATNGVDLIEEGLTLDWIIDRLQEHSRQVSEDIALWQVGDGESAWIVAIVRQGVKGIPAVQWL